MSGSCGRGCWRGECWRVGGGQGLAGPGVGGTGPLILPGASQPARWSMGRVMLQCDRAVARPSHALGGPLPRPQAFMRPAVEACAPLPLVAHGARWRACGRALLRRWGASARREALLNDVHSTPLCCELNPPIFVLSCRSRAMCQASVPVFQLCFLCDSFIRLCPAPRGTCFHSIHCFGWASHPMLPNCFSVPAAAPGR